jgi:hypothetical protein
VSRAVALSQLMTPVLRPALGDAVPLHSGKAPASRAARARSSGGAATARASVDFPPAALPMIASLSGMAARPLADIGGEANQISVGVLDEELMHTSFHVSGASQLRAAA